MKTEAYTREEIARIDDYDFPERGPMCPCCRAHIPAFADISSDTERKIRKLEFVEQIRAVRQATGCGVRWAKIWALHPDGPRQRVMGPPCPYCGKPLFTAQSKQCLECGWNWHDADHPVQHFVKKKQPNQALQTTIRTIPPSDANPSWRVASDL